MLGGKYNRSLKLLIHPEMLFDKIGLSSRMHPDLTIGTFCRWLAILDDQGPAKPFEVWRIIVAKCGVLSYTGTRLGEALLRDSTNILQPGDYAAYCRGMSTLHV
jgi:hypothetical protein